MKNILNKIFNPHKLVGIPLFVMGFILLIYVFSFHLEDSILAYIAYLWSTYSLIIFIVWFIKVCKFGNSYVKKKSRLYKFYKENFKVIMKISLIFSMIINFLYGIFKFGLGLYYKSFWFITFAIYYLVLWEMKFSLYKEINKLGKDLFKEYKILKRIGVILLFLNIVLVGMIVLIVSQNKNVIYQGNLIYIVALYDFSLIISAFISVLKYKKYNSPILISRKCINLTVAMISIISLEVAMIYHFGNNDFDFKIVMTASVGFVVALVNTIMAFKMIKKANKHLKQYGNE